MTSVLHPMALPARRGAAPARRGKRRVVTAGLIGVLLALSGCGTPAEPAAAQAASREEAADVGRLALGSKATYPGVPAGQELQAAPVGYEPVLVEHVARHGSRLLSSKKYDDLITQLWDLAEAQDALTETGRKLGPAVLEITEVHEDLGYGSLSGLGEREHTEMARRVYDRMQPLFDAAAAENAPVNVATSGVDRAVESSAGFVAGLEKAQPALAPVIQAPVTDKDLLYFHDTDQAYNAYLDEDKRLADAMDAVESNPGIEAAARRVLERLFSAAFIAELDAGAINLVDRGKGEQQLESVVDAAMYLYELYVIAPGMADEHEIDFSEFVTPEDAMALSIVSEAEDFYEKGPGFEGEDVTYRMADVLLRDMLEAVEGVRTGETRQAADFRFAHAEEIIPLAALLQLPGSTQQQETEDVFSYAANEWRGADVAPMASNIQWDVYATADSDVLVRMLYNEREIPFAFDCVPVQSGSFFYTDTELARCLADAAG